MGEGVPMMLGRGRAGSDGMTWETRARASRAGSWGAIGLALLVVSAVWLMALSSPASADAPHAPILISGNSGFTEPNGVVGGTGAGEDPYVIGGWEIDASAANGIEVRNTSAHFVIWMVRVHSGGTSFDGILFRSVSNATISDSVVQYNANGIRLLGVRAVTVYGTDTSLNQFDGVFAVGSSDVSVIGNRVEYDGDGIEFETSSDVRVNGNTVVLNRQDGIFFYNTTDSAVNGNAVTQNGWIGIHVSTAANVKVSANSVSGNDRTAIDIESSEQVLVHGNNLFSNLGNGIVATDVQDLVLSANSVAATGQTGVSVAVATDLEVSGNIVSGSRYGGIVISGAERASVLENEVANNSDGISLLFSRKIRVEGNNVSGNQGFGAYLADGESGEIMENRFEGNEIGIGIEGGSNATIWGNEVRDSVYGLYLFLSFAVRTYHNSFWANSVSAADDRGAENDWDHGYPSGGNYWSDYRGGDRCNESNQANCSGPDGIGDTPYGIDQDSRDRYPLMSPYGSLNGAPVAAFTISAREGEVGTLFAVDATPSTDDHDFPVTLQVRWDWEDDGVWDTPWSATKTAEHRYPMPGDYTVRLAVRDSEGVHGTAAIQVAVKPAPAPPILLAAGVAILVATVPAILAYWGYVWWRRGWFRRARKRQQRGPLGRG